MNWVLVAETVAAVCIAFFTLAVCDLAFFVMSAWKESP